MKSFPLFVFPSFLSFPHLIPYFLFFAFKSDFPLDIISHELHHIIQNCVLTWSALPPLHKTLTTGYITLASIIFDISRWDLGWAR